MSVPNILKAPEDTEGVWTYAYYSYTGNDYKVTGFIKYADKPFDTFTINVVHP